MKVEKVTRLSIFVRNLILQYTAAMLSTVKIQKLLQTNHNVLTTRQAIRKFLIRFRATGFVGDVPGCTKTKSKITEFHKQVINMWLTQNCEMTSKMIRDKLQECFGVKVSSSCVTKVRRQMGWTSQRVKYCQLISHKNRLVRKDWCLAALCRKETFQNVVFVDESTVEMSANGKLFFYRQTSCLQRLPARKQKPKHSYKVHIWGGISYRGRTDCCVFTGVMDSISYQGILQHNFLPFVEKRFPDGYRLYQDNDSKHKSKSTVEWMTNQNMIDKVMVCPASSPDINPIENVWSSLKQFLEYTVKPQKKDQLVNGIKQFWESLTAEQCSRYVDHIQKVLPVVVLNDGGPSGF